MHQGHAQWNRQDLIFFIRGTKSVSSVQLPDGMLTYMLNKKRCVASLTANDRDKSIKFAGARSAPVEE